VTFSAIQIGMAAVSPEPDDKEAFVKSQTYIATYFPPAHDPELPCSNKTMPP
jgi:hypothetical protein